MLLGGKGFGGVASLAYLAILARAIGLEDFGNFVMIFGLAQAFIAFAGFQSWQIIIRFGTKPALAGNWAIFGRLVGLCVALDLFGALTGVLLAGLLIWQFADDLGIPSDRIGPCFVLVSLAQCWSRECRRLAGLCGY